MMSGESGSEVSLKQEDKAEGNDSKIAISGESSEEFRREAQSAAENSTAVESDTEKAENEVDDEVLQSLSGSLVSKSSVAFPVRRVSSLTDLRESKGQVKSNLKSCRSEGNVSSTEFVTSFDASQGPEFSVNNYTGQQFHTSENDVEIVKLQTTSDEMVKKCEPTSIKESEPDVGEGDEITADEQIQVKQEGQYQPISCQRAMAHEQRQRSFSDSTYLKSPSVLTAEQLRKTKSYTTFPHINTQSTPSDSERASSVHRTSCFRIMPHLSDASFVNQDFPTVSVLSRSSQFENYHQNVACEISSESEDSERDLGKNEESVLHSWRRPSQKPRSYSEPLAMEPERRTRTCSLPNNIEEKRLPIDETMHKVKATPSRLQFPEQSLEKLKEENLSSRGHSPRSETSRPSSVMSLVDNCDSELGEQLFSPQDLPDGDEVMGHWINRNRKQSISKQPSFSLVKEVDEGNEEEDHETPSAVSLVNEVTEQVLSSHEVNVSSDNSDDDVSTVEAAVKLWKTKETGRRVTLASVSPLTDCPKYASEIEQQAFRRIKKWKDSFALKLNNVLGERFQEMAAKREEELNRKKRPKVLNVPMNLSEKEMGQLRNKMLLELKRKSIGSGSSEALVNNDAPLPPSHPIPRIKFPRRASGNLNPADLRSQMMKELSGRVSSCVPDDEEAFHCYKPSSLVPGLSRTSLETKRQNVVYIPGGIGYKILDPDSIHDLLSWHEAERKRLKAELEGLPQAGSGGKQVVIDRDDVNKVLQSMMKIMEDIFMGTMKRFIGSGESVATMASSEDGGKAHSTDVVGTTGVGDTAQNINSEPKQTKELEKTDDSESDFQAETARLDKGRMLTTEISSLPPSGSIKSLSSESTAELLSSESSLTGMSFSSSSDSFGVRDSTNTNTSMKDDVTAISANSSLVSLSSSLEDDEDSNKGRDSMSDSLPSEGKTQESDKGKLVRIESIELLLENSQDNLSNDMRVTPDGIPCEQFPTLNASKETSLLCSPKTECTDVTNKPRELTKRNGNTEAAENNYQNQIGHLQEAVQELTDSEDVLKQRLESLQNELKSAKNNSEYWFNQCVKKKEKIEELLIATRDVTSDNFELRQKINKKTRIINEKDQEIQKLTQSNTETEMILREVKERLSKANEETERLKLIMRQHDEEKRSSALQTDREALFKSLMSNSLKGNEKGSFSLTHKETTSMPSRDREGLQRKVNNSQFHPVSVSSLDSDENRTNRVNKEELTASDTNAKSTSAIQHGNRGAIPLTLPTSDGSGSLREPPLTTKFPMTKDPEKTKRDVKEWLSEVIRQAKTKLAGERVVSHHESIDKNERPRYAESEKEGAKCSLREAMSLFKGKISKDVSRLPKQRKKNISCLRFPKTKKNDGQEPLTTTGHVAKGSYVWNGNLVVERRADQQDKPTLDAKDANLTTNASADTFTSMEPFDGVFISDFDFMEFSTSGRMDSVEPFGEVFLPWMDSKDAENKQTTGVLEPNVTRKEQHPDNKVNLDEFFSASNAKKTEPKERKTGQSSVPKTDEKELVIRNLKEICLKGVQPERNPEQRTAEETPLHADKASVIRKEVDEPTGQAESKPSTDNRRLFLKGKRTPKQCNVASCMPTNSLQGSCGTNTRIAIGSVDETQQDDPFKLLMGFNEVTPFSNEFNTVERDIERLLVDLDSKTRSAVESQRKNTSSSEKVLKLKLNDSKSADHENQIILCNNNGFIDSITVEVKLNKEKLMNEFANGNIFDARQLQKEVKASVKATEVGKDTTVTNKERFVPERLKRLSQHKLQEQTLGEQGDRVGKQNVDLLTCKGTKSYGTEFAKQRRIATDRWISDLFKSIGAMEKIRELTENGQKKNEDVSRKKGSQVQETDLVGPFSNRPLHEPPVELLMNKQIVSKRTPCQNSSLITSSQSVKKGKGTFQSENDSLGTTERPVKTVPFGHKGQQRRAERDVRLALWQEKNERLRDINSELINHKNIEDGFVGKIGDKLLRSSHFIKEKDFKFSGRKKSPKMNTELAEHTRKSLGESSCLEDEKGLDFLVNMYKSTQDVLRKQAEQEIAIQECKNKVDCIAEEMETLQRKNTKEATLETGTKMVFGKMVSSV